MTNKEVVADIVNDLRALEIDDRISERYVLSKLKHFNALFLKRENDSLKAFYYDNIWYTVECIEMEAVDQSECADDCIPKVTSYMRSVQRIPDMYSYKGGPMIRELMSLDEGNMYAYCTPKDYMNISKREFQGKKRYFWMRNGHIVIPNSSTQSVTLTACFVDQYRAAQISSGYNVVCVEPMEDEFPCPQHMFGVVKDEAMKDLFTYYKRLDRTPAGK